MKAYLLFCLNCFFSFLYLLVNFEEIKFCNFIPISEADHLGEMPNVLGEVSLRFPELQPGHRKISSDELPKARESLQL
jgi:hypothetical protein